MIIELHIIMQCHQKKLIGYGIRIFPMQGVPGEGKSTMMMQLAALITTGKAMPDGSGDKIPGNVI
mgnify:CR=1 FL=1